jgi:hypothetical protein
MLAKADSWFFTAAGVTSLLILAQPLQPRLRVAIHEPCWPLSGVSRCGLDHCNSNMGLEVREARGGGGGWCVGGAVCVGGVYQVSDGWFL